MSGCIFCQIVNRSIEASVVYENDATLAFMDLRQPNPGHVLVMPKKHVATIYELDPDTASQLMQTVVIVARGIRTIFNPEGLNIWQSSGEAAGQEVFHLHMHLLPRYDGDGLMHIYSEPPVRPQRKQLDQWAQQLAKLIQRPR
ncbi:HIT family protein [soil metagenome]